jgi:hypothetical protein
MTSDITIVDYAIAPAVTFELPNDYDRKHILPGQSVKLVFEAEGFEGGERMWVQVTAASKGKYTGFLRNTPLFLPMEWGDLITFAWYNIINIEPYSEPKLN